jgi:diguanylate cyclase (GGDEF)-like protein
MRGRAFTAREERETERLAESLVYPLDNALEHHAALVRAMTDRSTGLRNQRALDQELPREIRLAQRAEHSLSLLLVSVDNLESISEHHGSEVGEQAWQSIAEALTQRLRQSDLIFRTDNNEFCIVLSDTCLDGAVVLAERLRKNVDRCVSYDNVQLVLTASAGVTELGASETAAVLLARAAEALAMARQAGRNQVRAMVPPEPVDDAGPTAAA